MSTTTDMALTEADENAIRDLVALAQESQNDPEGLIALHTAETAIVNLAGRRVLGRDAYAKAMAAALASPLSDVLTTVEIVDIRLATTDVAIVSCTKTVHDGRSGVDLPGGSQHAAGAAPRSDRLGGKQRLSPMPRWPPAG